MNLQKTVAGDATAGSFGGPGGLPAMPPKQRSVLVIDHHDSVRDAVELGLQRLGFTTLAARDADRGLELFCENRADIACVLTVLAVPGAEGHTVVAKLREAGPTTPVLVMSGYRSLDAARELGDPTTRLAAEQLLEGPDDPLMRFLPKPFGITDLRDALEKFAEREVAADG